MTEGTGPSTGSVPSSSPYRIILSAVLLLLVTATARAQVLDISEHTRPGMDEGPTEVRVELYVVDIQRIVDVEQIAYVDFLVGCSWLDERHALTDTSEGLRTRILKPDTLWHPRIQLKNIRRLWPQLPDCVRVERSGRCSVVQRYVGMISCPLALQDFPFDSQEVRFEFLSAGHRPEEVRLIVDAERCGRSERFSLVDWSIGAGSFGVKPLVVHGGDRAVASFFGSFPARRYANYHLLKVILPLIMIVAMSFTVFWIPAGQFGSRVSVGATSVLTLIAYRFLLGALVPRVSYMTSLDVFILGATMVVFLALVETLIAYIRSQGHDRAGGVSRLDRWARVLGPVSILALILFAFLV